MSLLFKLKSLCLLIRPLQPSQDAVRRGREQVKPVRESGGVRGGACMWGSLLWWESSTQAPALRTW